MGAKRKQDHHVIVLIDGVCHMCQGLTKFIIERDPAGLFKFASLQSDIARYMLRQGGLPEETMETVVVVENNTYYTRSAAALRIIRRLSFPWRLLYGFIIIPRPLRDLIYKWVAKNRYRWFGKDEACMIPTPDIRSRFLE
ncbi:thiol-disulfide oxidoreductase DCC family protein [Paenibacillus faecalis]|uniref:thiol-disulfide oxidoreductase DCC family protein n=1 Tax=Paenibacillus faecalis TaxID=2079532 RepID=UPI000D0FA5A4|nr:thiol-disulfide oxidoreductase DCC family protein [Paenibacillus faecalis]